MDENFTSFAFTSKPLILFELCFVSGFLVIKNLLANVGDIRELGSVPGLGRSPLGGHSNPLQFSCLENPMEKGAGQATVYSAAQSNTTDVI